MAKPRVFISSTYYDLKHVRGSLEVFLDTLGFEGVLSEKGDIPYSPFEPLDESCYREVSNVDIFVLIIGGRYGSPASGQDDKGADFYKKYDSITKREYEEAVERGIPIYILIESNVKSEYRTYLKNKENRDVKYAHVDSVNIFELIKDILSKRKNNPFITFEKASEIENWLKEQWTGLFRDLLQRKSRERELTTLSAQVSELKEINNTLKKYLESVLKEEPRDDAIKLIQSEEERLQKQTKRTKLRFIPLFRFWHERYKLSLPDFIDIMSKSNTPQELGPNAAMKMGETEIANWINRALEIPYENQSNPFKRDVNNARRILELPPLFDEEATESDSIDGSNLVGNSE